MPVITITERTMPCCGVTAHMAAGQRGEMVRAH
jgi:hypothetical protein